MVEVVQMWLAMLAQIVSWFGAWIFDEDVWSHCIGMCCNHDKVMKEWRLDDSCVDQAWSVCWIWGSLKNTKLRV